MDRVALAFHMCINTRSHQSGRVCMTDVPTCTHYPPSLFVALYTRPGERDIHAGIGGKLQVPRRDIPDVVRPSYHTVRCLDLQGGSVGGTLIGDTDIVIACVCVCVCSACEGVHLRV